MPMHDDPYNDNDGRKTFTRGQVAVRLCAAVCVLLTCIAILCVAAAAVILLIPKPPSLTMEDISLVEFKVDEYCPRTGNSGCCGGVSCAFQFNRDKADIRFQRCALTLMLAQAALSISNPNTLPLTYESITVEQHIGAMGGQPAASGVDNTGIIAPFATTTINITIDWFQDTGSQLDNVRRVFCDLNTPGRESHYSASFTFLFKISQLRYLFIEYPFQPFSSGDTPLRFSFASQCSKMGNCDLAGFYDAIC